MDCLLSTYRHSGAFIPVSSTINKFVFTSTATVSGIKNQNEMPNPSSFESNVYVHKREKIENYLPIV